MTGSSTHNNNEARYLHGVAIVCLYTLWSRSSSFIFSEILKFTWFDGNINTFGYYEAYHNHGVAPSTLLWSRSLSLVLSHAHHYITSYGADAGRNSDEVNHLYGVAYGHFSGRGVPTLVVVTVYGLLYLMVNPILQTVTYTITELPMTTFSGRGV